MSLFAVILILVISLSEFDLFVGISDWISNLNQLCLSFTPSSAYAEIYSALICGNPTISAGLSQIFKNLGIYHAIIVSGSHLVFLSLLIEKLFYSHRLENFRIAALPVLLFYSLATGAEPPVIRAFIGIILNIIQKKKKLFWSQSEVVFLSLLLCLLLSSSWKNSYSLLLSYVASLSLTLVHEQQFLKRNAYIYLIIFPFLLPLCPPHPMSIITNAILSPLIGIVLFPLSFVSFLVPYCYYFTDFLWKIFLMICELFGSELETLPAIRFSIFYLWAIAVLLNFYGVTREKKVNL